MTSFYSKVEHPLTTEDIWNKTEFLTRREAATWTKVSDYWFEKHAHDGKGPPFSPWGRKAFYRKCDLIAWLEKMQASGKLDALYKASAERRAPSPSPLEMEISRKRKKGAAEIKDGSAVTEVALAKALAEALISSGFISKLKASVAHA